MSIETAGAELCAGRDTLGVQRASAAERAERAIRDRWALDYLRRNGHEDVAVILGLSPDPTRAPRPARSHVAIRFRAQRRCLNPACGRPYIPNDPDQKTCSRTCGGVLAGHTRRAARKAAS